MSKRCLAFLLVLVTIFTSLNFSFIDNVEAADATARYTVLVVDTSGSMGERNSAAMNVAKEASKKFCDTIFHLDDNEYIAVIGFDSSPSLFCDFTDNLSNLEKSIDKMYANGGTNAGSALTMAGLIFKDVPESATKNIILLSDGDASSGVSVSNTLKDDGFNIYTLGFFHSGTKTSGAESILRQIQNRGYWEVTDVSQLEFTFGEITNEILDTVVRESWVLQHKRYLDDPSYKKYIVDGFQGVLKEMAETEIDDAKVLGYDTLTTMKKFLGKEDWGYVDEYEFLIAQLMANEGSYTGIRKNFLANLTQEFSDTGKYVVEYLEKIEDSGVVYFDGSKLTHAERLAKLKDAFNTFVKSDVGSKAFKENFNSFVKAADSFGEAGLSKSLMKYKGDFLSSATEITMNTLSKVITYIAYGRAFKQTSQDFKDVLIMMSYQLSINYKDVGESNDWRFLQALIYII